mgnify:CR=1 FL=1
MDALEVVRRLQRGVASGYARVPRPREIDPRLGPAVRLLAPHGGDDARARRAAPEERRMFWYVGSSQHGGTGRGLRELRLERRLVHLAPPSAPRERCSRRRPALGVEQRRRVAPSARCPRRRRSRAGAAPAFTGSRPTPCSDIGHPPMASTASPNSAMAASPACTSSPVRGMAFAWMLPSDTWPQSAWIQAAPRERVAVERHGLARRSMGTIMSPATLCTDGCSRCAALMRRFTASGTPSRIAIRADAGARRPAARPAWDPSGPARTARRCARAPRRRTRRPPPRPRDNSAARASAGNGTPCSRSRPSSRRRARQRASTDSIEATSSPSGAVPLRRPIASSRRRATAASASSSVSKPAQTSRRAGARRTSSTASVITPSGALRAHERVHQVHAGLGVVAGGALGDARHRCARRDGHGQRRPVSAQDLEVLRPAARQSPRASSSTSPLASTTVSPRTQSRVEAVLERGRARGVGRAHPAHQRAAEGRQPAERRRPCGRTDSSRLERATPAPARTVPSVTSPIASSRASERTDSPNGVAPPVRDDCAPTGSTAGASRRTHATSRLAAWEEHRGRVPAGSARRILQVGCQLVGRSSRAGDRTCRAAPGHGDGRRSHGLLGPEVADLDWRKARPRLNWRCRRGPARRSSPRRAKPAPPAPSRAAPPRPGGASHGCCRAFPRRWRSAWRAGRRCARASSSLRTVPHFQRSDNPPSRRLTADLQPPRDAGPEGGPRRLGLDVVVPAHLHLDLPRACSGPPGSA